MKSGQVVMRVRACARAYVRAPTWARRDVSQLIGRSRNHLIPAYALVEFRSIHYYQFNHLCKRSIYLNNEPLLSLCVTNYKYLGVVIHTHNDDADIQRYYCESEYFNQKFLQMFTFFRSYYINLYCSHLRSTLN